MVNNMYILLESNGGYSGLLQDENTFGGIFCRSTEYRLILDAFKSLAINNTATIDDIEELPSNDCRFQMSSGVQLMGYVSKCNIVCYK